MGGRQVYWSGAGRAASLAYLLVAGWVVSAPLLAGDAVGTARLGAWALTGGVGVYAVLWRPAVVVDAGAVTLRNVLRDVRIPWGALDEVRTRYALTLVAGGTSHRSWAAPAPGRPLPVSPTVVSPTAVPRGPEPAHRERRASRDLRSDSGAAALLVESAWTRWRESAAGSPGQGPGGTGSARLGSAAPQEVAVRWNRGLVTCAVVCAAVTLLI